MLLKAIGRKPIYVYISAIVFVLSVIIIAPILTVVYQYSFNEGFSKLKSLASSSILKIEQGIQTDQILIKTMLSGARFSAVQYANNWEQRRSYFEEMSDLLAKNSLISSGYIAYGNGDYLLIGRAGELAQEGIEYPGATKWYAVEVSADNSTNRMLFLNQSFDILGVKNNVITKYDSRQQAWYKSAMSKEKDVVFSEPYHGERNAQVQITAAVKTLNRSAVIGVHFSLELFAKYFQNENFPVQSLQFLINESGQPYYIERKLNSPIEVLKPIAQYANLDPVIAVIGDYFSSVKEKNSIEVKEYEVANKGTWLIYFSKQPDSDLLLAIAVSKQDLYEKTRLMIAKLFSSLIFALFFIVPMVWYIARAIDKPLLALNLQAKLINQFNFHGEELAPSSIIEVDELIQAVNRIKSTLDNFIHLGTLMAGVHDFDSLQESLLLESCKVMRAERATLYVKDKQDILLAQKFCVDGQLSDRGFFESLSSFTLLNSRMEERQTVVVQLDAALWGEHLHSFGAYPGARTLIAVPLLDHAEILVGVLTMVLPFQEGDALLSQVKLVEAISGSAASALVSQRLILDQQKLIDSFIELIAGAIDIKSPYTGGHCLRVPELAYQIAKAASQQQSGVFADFKPDENEWETIRIASWLHDCGKITTPEFVVDKATKLETIYNRIHEVRTRFEVLKRDIHIERLQQELTLAQRQEILASIQADWLQLDEEFTFVARCNTGAFYTSSGDAERIRTIAQRSWLRTMDNRQGLSREELLRMPDAVEPLPVRESLLSDRIEHLVARPLNDDGRDHDRYGFKMKVPEYLYNRGEIHNLTIVQGTLTEEERYKVNDHIIQTVKILESLPFPPHLARVAEFAAGHHERMDGRGYPRQVLGATLPLPSRIIALADIFEALTACDRPYKEAKTIAEALMIMRSMALNGHIDPDLYNLFIEMDIWHDYGNRFLNPKQLNISEVDKIALHIEPQLLT